MVSHHLAKFDGHWHCGYVDIIVNSHMSFSRPPDLSFMRLIARSTSREVTILPILVTTDTALVEI